MFHPCRLPTWLNSSETSAEGNNIKHKLKTWNPAFSFLSDSLIWNPRREEMHIFFLFILVNEPLPEKTHGVETRFVFPAISTPNCHKSRENHCKYQSLIGRTTQSLLPFLFQICDFKDLLSRTTVNPWLWVWLSQKRKSQFYLHTKENVHSLFLMNANYRVKKMFKACLWNCPLIF